MAARALGWDVAADTDHDAALAFRDAVQKQMLGQR
jgi:hypothetical protein